MDTAAAAGEPARDARDARALALQRLQASRRRLRAELLPEDDDAHDDAASGHGRPRRRRWSTLWRRLRRRVASNPATAVALHALDGWWSRQPWRATAEAMAEHAEHVLVPWVRRHPALAVSVAGAAGAGLVLGRRRLGPFVRARLNALPSRLLHAAFGLLTQPAVQALLASWVLATATPCRDDEAAAGETGGDGTAPPPPPMDGHPP